MVIKNPVIIMSLYDIGRDNWNSFNLSYNTYLFWMKNTLSLNANIVVYTEQKFVDSIIEMRKEFDFDLSKTIIITKNLEDLDCYKIYNEKLEKLMFSEEFKSKVHHNVPEMEKPLYNIIMFNKLNFLKDVKDNNYFNSDFLIWADCGGLRDNISLYKNVIWPNLEKINSLDNEKVTFFSHHDTFSITDNEFHAMSQIRFIQGTSFFVPINLIDDLVIEFNKTIEDCLSKNFIGSDEKIFDITYCRNKEKYNLIKCGWRTYFKLFKEEFELVDDGVKRIFIDLGTHNCQALNHFIYGDLGMNKNWEIHSFEPNPLVNSENCVKSFSEHKINLHKKAAWTFNGEILFKQYGNDGRSEGSLIAETKGDIHYHDYYSETNVPCIDFYEFLSSFQDDSEIYIKMDIESSEYFIIQDMLKRGWPKNIKRMWVEWHDRFNQKTIELISKLKKEIQENKTEIIDWH